MKINAKSFPFRERSSLREQSSSEDRRSGHTLLEMSIAVTVTSIMIAIVLSVGVETLGFSSYMDEDFTVQYEANRAFDRTSEIIRKVGWNTEGAATYPAVAAGLGTISFRVLDDLDGNGYSFDATTGELEWSAGVFTIALNPDDRTLYVFDENNNAIWTLGRYIDSVRFETVQQDNTLQRPEVRVEITASRLTNDGNTITYTAAGSINMRN